LLGIKYSILMPYWNRAPQLANTLASFRHFYSSRKDWEVVIVEDAKNVKDAKFHAAFNKVIASYVSYMLITVPEAEKDTYNPAPLFNQAADAARGDYFVLTSPECIHTTDILAGLDQEFSRSSSLYVVCACKHIRPRRIFYAPESFEYKLLRWYQHSKRRNVGYHFCSAISRDNYQGIGGFDEEYAHGVAYDDDDFREKVMDAGIPFVYRDDLVVLHQEHPKLSLIIERSKYKMLLKRNERYFLSKWRKGVEGSKVA